jgi:hypothetical protein
VFIKIAYYIIPSFVVVAVFIVAEFSNSNAPDQKCDCDYRYQNKEGILRFFHIFFYQIESAAAPVSGTDHYRHSYDRRCSVGKNEPGPRHPENSGNQEYLRTKAHKMAAKQDGEDPPSSEYLLETDLPPRRYDLSKAPVGDHLPPVFPANIYEI